MEKFLKCFLFTIILISAVMLSAQTGSLKIFSEIDSIDVYVDDVFQGIGKVSIESVPIGSHYLKIKKDNIVILSELIEIKEKTLTSILLKDSPEIQKKMLEGMAKEIAQYDSEKISVLYETTWYIAKGGARITEQTFAQITNDETVLARMKSADKVKTILTCIGTPCIIGGGIVYIMSIVKMALGDPLYPGASTSTSAGIFNIMVLGALPMSTGISLVVSGNDKKTYYSYDSARERAQKYNDNIKAKLGLPANYDIQ